MASTNKTTNYGLSQFIETDRPAWLTDYNGDMRTIDSTMKAISDVASGASGSISALADRMSTAEGNITTNTNNIVTLDARADALEAGAQSQAGTIANIQTEQTAQNLGIEAATELGYNLARPYDSASTYAVGDYVLFQNTLYKCITAVPVGEAFDATKWLAIKATDEIAAGGYTLPIASASQLGGVKVGSGLSIDASGVLSASNTPSSGIIPFIGDTGDKHYGTWNNYPSVSRRPTCTYYKIGNLVYVIVTTDVSCLGSSDSSGYFQFTVDTSNIPSELYTPDRINIPLSVYIGGTVEADFQNNSHNIYNASLTYQRSEHKSSVSYLTIYSHTMTDTNISVGGSFTLTGFFYLPNS